MAPILESVRIKNYKSLGDISLNFKKLTVIVGANSSGKSSCLESLRLLRDIVKQGKTDPSQQIENDIRKGREASGIFLQVSIKDRKKIDYSLNLVLGKDVEENSVILSENLKVGRTKVISISKGEGEVCDEDNQGAKQPSQPYRSTPDTVALSSTGNFGFKPVTLRVADFIKQWEFYNLVPENIRMYTDLIAFRDEFTVKNSNILDISGFQLQGLLQYWASDKNSKIFKQIVDEVKRYLSIELIVGESKKGRKVVKVKEPNGSEISFDNLSDGTLRMIGYCYLLYSSHIPTLIAIEEPERNLHPAILLDLASILKRLAQKTQVVITTHSSQLLDCFSIEDISNDVSIILFKKDSESGTEALSLDTLNQRNAGLQDWMQDFGIGSAVYHSNLIQEVLEN
jgi:predicted ATPase